ncbi:MAG: FMN-binding glutamate synthase family protein [Saprospiraceae bacterium]|nr:FMN-binding glutamate synthase family protein [Saprospiraceae bacterium]
MRRKFFVASILTVAVVLLLHLYVWPGAIWLFALVGPLIAIGIYDLVQTRHTLLRNFPVVGHGRYISDWLRPKIYQYFVEPDYDGRPFPRLLRSVVYQRAKNVLDTSPYGTQYDVYSEGYEWMNHSIAAIDPHDLDNDPRVLVGSSSCGQPYSASIFNVSAMSFGSLSKNAIMALNGGAKAGNFAHNTGEGGISPYHNKFGGDLIYQIGTGYFGCRSKDGSFDPGLYQERTAPDNVKMIELKLSQGAKPGHGGILPAKKVTPEIAQIRNIEPYKDVLSPPYHTAFSTPKGLLEFIQQLRALSGGKPVGFKLCIGHKAEFLSICRAMDETRMFPDFITIDGGEGGTGAAPLEFSDSVGMPFKEGLAFAYNALEGFDLKREIKLIAAGKIVSGFHIFRALALGADLCYSARAMMMALGCIQALECNKNTCPTGVATQNEALIRGLVVSDKKERVANYHRETVQSFVELMGASGIRNLDQINRAHVYRRIVMNRHERYDQIYPYLQRGCLLHSDTVPEEWKFNMSLSSADAFMLHQPLKKLHL